MQRVSGHMTRAVRLGALGTLSLQQMKAAQRRIKGRISRVLSSHPSTPLEMSRQLRLFMVSVCAGLSALPLWNPIWTAVIVDRLGVCVWSVGTHSSVFNIDGRDLCLCLCVGVCSQSAGVCISVKYTASA